MQLDSVQAACRGAITWNAMSRTIDIAGLKKLKVLGRLTGLADGV
jgi:hypothetical protein